MDSKSFSFIAGSFTSLFWTTLPSAIFIFLLLICICLPFKKGSQITFFLVGMIWMASVGHWQYSLQLSSEQTNQPVQIIGKVSTLVISHTDIRFNLKVTEINDVPLFVPKTFRLSWRSPTWQVQKGQRVKLRVKVKPPHGLANEAGFHYQQWLFSEGIIATGYVKTHIDNQLLQESKNVRQKLLNDMLALDLEHQSWLAALTFGYRALLQTEDWQLVQKTGIAHLIAISGLHLALVASVSYVLIAWLVGAVVSRFYFLHRINLHNMAVVLTLFSTLAYSALAGFGLPTLRAWLMLCIFSVLFLSNKHVSAKRLILLGLCAFILLFPLSLFGLSFWLSFSAVIIISFVFWRWPVKGGGFSIRAMLLGMLKVQLCLTILMLPLVAWQFSYISTVSPIVNLIAVPVVTMVLVPICLFAVVCLVIHLDLAQVLFSWADAIISHGLVFLDFAATRNGAYFNLPNFPVAVWCLVFVFVVLSFLPCLSLNKKYLGLLLLPLVSYLFSPNTNTWQIDVLDVGQGVAVLITKGQHAIIYDVGASYPSGFNMADSVLLPMLQARGLSNVDMVFISHGDNDHAGSLPQLLKGTSVSEVLTNQDSCQQGLNIMWQGLSIQALWPKTPIGYSNNNGSCVIKIADEHHSILLPGDIDKSIERKLIKDSPQLLKADILLAAHHGSNTSSSGEFIEAVGAKYVVFSQGFMNRWLFPRQDVLDRFQQVNNESAIQSRLFSTSSSGQVTFTMQYNLPKPIVVKTFRQDTYPFWYANSSGY